MSGGVGAVTLTQWESRICSFVGKQRYANACDLDRDPGAGPSGAGGDEFHIRGAHCEFGGWLFARNAKLYPLCRDFGDPAHFIEQSDLLALADLLWVLEGKR